MRTMNYQRSALASFLALASGAMSACAFSPPSSRATTSAKNMVATAPPPVTGSSVGADGDSTVAPMGWECDEEANCVMVPACDEEGCRTSLDVRIHGDWYDLSGECARTFF